MATIIDPDDLKLSTQPASGTPNGSVYIDPTTNPPTIELISTDQYSGTGSFAPADGVTVQALYSFLKEQWKSSATFIKYPFPMEAITSEQFEFINNWEPKDTTTNTRKYLRTGGWSETNGSTVKRQYMGVKTLGTINAGQTAYYSWYTSTSPAGFVTNATNFTYDGVVDEAVKIYEGTTSPTFDYRGSAYTLNVYIRPNTTGSSGSVIGYTYNQSDTKAIGAQTVTYQVYRFPLSTAVDLNLTLTDAEITTLISNKSMSITWYASNQASNTFLPFDLNGGPYNFRVIINSGAGTATTSDIYNYVQYQLRQSGDIDAGSPGTQTGKLTNALVTFVGSTLETFDILPLDATNGGVAIDGFDANFTNNIKMRDNTNALRSFPITSAGTITFNTNLIEDAASKYWMFYTNNFGTGSAALVQDKSAANITGDLHYVVNTSGTSTGSTTAGLFTMTVSGAGWTINAFANKVLYVSSGTNVGYYWIVSNTTDTLTLETAFENTDAAMSWQIRNKNTAGVISWNFDYTGGGGTDKNVTVVAIGLSSAQYVSAPFTIGSGTGQTFPLVAPLERNYSDPL